tara:strand:- start:19 stop:513 length:495 start_codon:yes stop_codon:yes gene_type:complete
MAEQAPPAAPADMAADEAALMKEIDAILGMEGQAPPEGAPPMDAPMDEPIVVEDAPADEMEAGDMPPEDGGAIDVSAIVEAMGVTEERAMQLYEASQTIPAMEGIPPEELAMALSSDFTLLMQLEKVIGSKADMDADDAMMVEGDTVEDEDEKPADEDDEDEEK